jgi:hypothetical protein
MQPLDRRSIVRAAAAAAAGALALPDVLRAFAEGQDPQPDRQQPGGNKPRSRAEQVAAAVARCKAEGKPLLVFVVPARREDHRARALCFSAFLDYGGNDTLLDVASCVPVCAIVEDLKVHLGGKAIAGEPMMLLVDVAAGTAPAVAAIDPKVDEPDLESIARLREEFLDEKKNVEEFLAAEQAAQRKIFVRANEVLAAELHKALSKDGDSMTRLAQRVRDRLGEAARQQLDGWLAGGAVPADELLVRAAAVVRVAAGKQPDAQRAATTSLLLAAIDRALIHKRIAGSLWLTWAGCGERIEDPEPGEPVLDVACGRGHVPLLSLRFLRFLTSS